jgi:hypothetical protein
MRIGQRTNRPPALMLSHCVPAAEGHADRRRAWQLLQWLTPSHRVFLACVYDAPLHQRDWRAAYLSTQRLAIEPTPARRRWFARAAALLDPQAFDDLMLGPALHAPVAEWLNVTTFDAVVRTHPALGLATALPDARVHVVDMRLADALNHADALADPARQLHLALVDEMRVAHAVRRHCEFAMIDPSAWVDAADAPQPDAWAHLLQPRPTPTTQPVETPLPTLARAA